MFIAQTSEAQRGRLIKCQGQRGGGGGENWGGNCVTGESGFQHSDSNIGG